MYGVLHSHVISGTFSRTHSVKEFTYPTSWHTYLAGLMQARYVKEVCQTLANTQCKRSVCRHTSFIYS